MLSPLILGDIAVNGILNSADVSALNIYLSGSPSTLIPTYPGAPSNNPAGPDPTLSIPADLYADADGVVTVPVEIDDPHPEGSRGLTQAVLALTYDPAVFRVSAADVHLGTVPLSGTGWTLTAVVDAETGQVAITLYSVTPIGNSASGSLVTIDFHAQSGATDGAESINLAAEVNPYGQGVVRTALADDQGVLALHLETL